MKTKTIIAILLAIVLLAGAQLTATAAPGPGKGVRHIEPTEAIVFPARGPLGLAVYNAPNVRGPIVGYLQNFEPVTVTACKGFPSALAKTEYGWVRAWNLRPNPCGGER